MEIQDLLNRTEEIITVYKGLTFKSQVFTERLTPAYKTQLLSLLTAADEGNEERKDETAVMLSDLIKSWTDGDDEQIVLNGVEFAPLYDNLKQLSFQLLAMLMRDITTHLANLANPKQ